MERAEWLKKMRALTEALYDHFAPAYWVKYGQHPDETHRLFIRKLLDRVGAGGIILSAGCGAGRFDGMLLEAGHRVLGIDQSGGMLARAREHFPEERFPGLRYVKMGLQEMDFKGEFDGAICIEAMEHVSPEDWPGIVARFQKALKPGGMLCITVDMAEEDELQQSYEKAIADGLPVLPGEVVDEVEAASAEIMAQGWQEVSGDRSDKSVYHYYPPLGQVRLWLDQAGFAIEEEGTGDGYAHFLARRKE